MYDDGNVHVEDEDNDGDDDDEVYDDGNAHVEDEDENLNSTYTFNAERTLDSTHSLSPQPQRSPIRRKTPDELNLGGRSDI